MTTQMNKQWTLKQRPSTGPIADSCFELKQSPLPSLSEGEVLVHNRMLSFDPTQRFWMERDTYMPAMPLGGVIRSLAAGVVIESRHPQFPVGTRVSGLLGWQEYAICGSNDAFPLLPIPAEISDEAALSVFGMTGLTAYFGMTDIIKPRVGETVVVSGAAGATGSIAAQIARIHGATVIGIAGGERKCRWLTETAKIQHAIDYKSENLRKRLHELAPHGINAYFDNVGGSMLDEVLRQLSLRARIALCGGIEGYSGEVDASIHSYMNLVMTRSKMEGFLISDFQARFQEGAAELGKWLARGELSFAVDVQKGFENAPHTLRRLFEGKNLGKQVLAI
jgi:NADPH-dependent curcumin reductase CurA